MVTLTITRNGLTRTSEHADADAAQAVVDELTWGREWVRTVGGKHWLYRQCWGLYCDGFPHADGSHSHRVGRYKIV